MGDRPGTTISVGFRAPNYKSVITALWEDVSNNCLSEDDAFYRDGDNLRTVPVSAGEITNNVLGTMRAEIEEKVSQIGQPVFTFYYSYFVLLYFNFSMVVITLSIVSEQAA